MRALAIIASVAALGSTARADDGLEASQGGTTVRDRPGFLDIAMRTSVGTIAVADDQHRIDYAIGLAAVVTVLPIVVEMLLLVPVLDVFVGVPLVVLLFVLLVEPLVSVVPLLPFVAVELPVVVPVVFPFVRLAPLELVEP